MDHKKYYFNIPVLFAIIIVSNASKLKSSLTIVIDDTGSMSDDIEQVMEGADMIFDTVMNSNSSHIEDFVLVTFNDPDGWNESYKKPKLGDDLGAKVLSRTTNRIEFKNKLRSINVDGGGLCPELAMTGIELALQNSRDGSSLYVFTDASAKDFEKYNAVQALAQSKQSQVVFVLTGICGSKRDKDYLVYQQLAWATTGQVFHAEKRDIGQLLKYYVTSNIESRKNTLASKTFPSGYGNSFDVNVDGDIHELTISVSGEDAVVEVNNSEGTKMPTEKEMTLPEIAFVKVLGLKPDIYKVTVGSKSATHVVVSGTTSIHFQHGFSVIKPSSITDTVAQPVPGIKSFLGIKLEAEGDVRLKNIHILDMNDKVIAEKPLKLVDETEQFYVTEPVETPTDLFKIAITGYDTKSKTHITRIGLTPIKPQDPTIEDVYERAPEITIEEGHKVKVEYDDSLRLKCLVSGYPKSDIVWKSSDGAHLSFSVLPKKLPYDYVSVLEIDRVQSNKTYECSATNSFGTQSKIISVETNLKRVFEVIEKPKDTRIEYRATGQLFCKVNAYPPATITWYKGLQMINSDQDVEISDDNTTVTIKSMQTYLSDNYICEARNEFNRKVFPFHVRISGIAKPKIDKTIDYIEVVQGSSYDILCRIERGKPTPNISWFFKKEVTETFINLPETTETIHIDAADTEQNGVYRCIAHNEFGQDNHEIDVSIASPPHITKKVQEKISVKSDENVNLACHVDGKPIPIISWYKNGTKIYVGGKYHIYRDGTLGFKASIEDEDIYTCRAFNPHGRIEISTSLNVVEPVKIQSPKKSTHKIFVGSSLVLPCVADGHPRPSLSWTLHDRDTGELQNLKFDATTGSVSITRAQLNQDGYYTCNATNSGGSTYLTYDVTVQAPPVIISTKKEYKAVAGDLLLRIPCHATGRPTPNITWTKHSFDLPMDSNWYDQEHDGSLIIKSVDAGSAGTYLCTAENDVGKDYATFIARIDPYPKSGIHVYDTLVEKGKTVPIRCPIGHSRIDSVRWFKDDKLIAEGELTLHNVSFSDSGLYLCRVSSFRNARTGTMRVAVGYKPNFINANGDKTVDFQRSFPVAFDCRAEGNPEPKVTWAHNDKFINITDYVLNFDMNYGDEGHYTCYVENKYGSITQDFDIVPTECTLQPNAGFNDNAPLMLTPSYELSNFDTSDGNMRIPKEENIVLVCPSGFTKIPDETEIEITCEGDKRFNYEDKTYAYSDFKCSEKIKPTARRAYTSCSYGSSELIKIGFDTDRQFLTAYEVCLDIKTRTPIYTKQTMLRPLGIDNPSYDVEWFGDDMIPIDLNAMYECSDQNREISVLVDKEFHSTDGCCFARRQLVNAKDMSLALYQEATYSHLNILPHWSTCNSRNWDDIERRVRDFSVSVDRPLLVWTGAAHQLQMSDAYLSPVDVFVTDGRREQPVPKFLWKVVQDTAARESLAIIQVNAPDLTLKDVNAYRLCDDICDKVHWMRNTRWRNFQQGYTYCCSLPDFLRAFRLRNTFEKDCNNVLSGKTLPENSLHVI